jgi:cytidylate kinase
MQKLTIAIDGPAGAGKSTVARIVAQKLRYTYIDTGAMYRAVTWKVINRHVDICDTDQVTLIAQSMKLSLECTNSQTLVKVDGSDVTNAIRTPEVSRLVSEVSKVAGVREAMVSQQRQLAHCGGAVLDGRDIGTHVLPNADIKIFLTASIEERAKRRWREFSSKGYEVNLETLQEDIANRDRMDCEREISPLIQATDAILIDTSGLSINSTVEKILKLCEAKVRGL